MDTPTIFISIFLILVVIVVITLIVVFSVQGSGSSPPVCGGADSSSITCVNSKGEKVNPICGSDGKSYVCPDGVCDNSKNLYQCLQRDTETDELILTYPSCTPGGNGDGSDEYVCPSGTIQCPLGGASQNAPVPLCNTWSTTRNAYTTSCPVLNSKSKTFECKDYFQWGNRRPPINVNPDVEKDVGGSGPYMINNDTYYPGTRGVGGGANGADDPAMGTLAYCQDEPATSDFPYCSSSDSSSSNDSLGCAGGRFNSGSTANLFPKGDEESGTITGYRVVSPNSNPYYARLENRNGNSFCGNGTPFITKSDNNTTNSINKTTKNQNDEASCQAQCNQDDKCFMYVYQPKPPQGNLPMCTTGSRTSYSTAGTMSYIRNDSLETPRSTRIGGG